MKLKSRALVTEEYKGQSKYDFWKNIKVDDVLQVSTTIRKYFRGGNGLNATQILIENERTGETFKSTMSMAYNYLSQIKYEEINEQL